MKRCVFIDGKYLDVHAALLDTFTPGHQKREGVFETLRVNEGTIAYFNEHAARLSKGLRVLRLRQTYTATQLKRVAQTVVRKNPSIKLGRLRLMIFRDGKDMHCAVMLLPYKPPTAQQYRDGLRLTLIKTDRPATARTADLKSLDYALFADAQTRAQAQGYDEALLLNQKGHIFEATRANVFIVDKGTLLTPPLSSGCLNGVTRRQLIETACRLRVPVKQQNITPAMLKRAERIFLTNSLMGIVPAHL